MSLVRALKSVMLGLALSIALPSIASAASVVLIDPNVQTQLSGEPLVTLTQPLELPAGSIVRASKGGTAHVYYDDVCYVEVTEENSDYTILEFDAVMASDARTSLKDDPMCAAAHGLHRAHIVGLLAVAGIVTLIVDDDPSSP